MIMLAVQTAFNQECEKFYVSEHPEWHQPAHGVITIMAPGDQLDETFDKRPETDNGMTIDQNFYYPIGCGYLVNNTKGDGTPYVLTAAHFFDQNGNKILELSEQNLTKQYLYIFPGHKANSTFPNTGVKGAVIKKIGQNSWTGWTVPCSDYILLELLEKPVITPHCLDVLYLGWNMEPDFNPSSSVLLHLPAGLPYVQISKADSPMQYSGKYCKKSQLLTWDYGIECYGSSGSPIFDQNSKCVYGHVSAGGYGMCKTNHIYWCSDSTWPCLLSDYWDHLQPFLAPDWEPGQPKTCPPATPASIVYKNIEKEDIQQYTLSNMTLDGTNFGAIGASSALGASTITIADDATLASSWANSFVLKALLNDPDMCAYDSNEEIEKNVVPERKMQKQTAVQQAQPENFQLHQNFPNPFNPSTTIRFDLAHECHVKLLVYNASGQFVVNLVNARLNAGHHKIFWDIGDYRGDLSSGIYVYQLITSDFVHSKKMLLLK